MGFVVNKAPAPTSSPIPCPSPPPLRRRRCRRLLRPPPRLSDLLLLRHWLGVLAGQRWQEEAYSAIESPSGSARGVQQIELFQNVKFLVKLTKKKQDDLI